MKKCLSTILAASISFGCAGFNCFAEGEARDVSIPIEMAGLYNTPRIYSSVYEYTNGNAGYAGTFYRPDFIALPYWDDDADWENSETNTMTFNDVKFKFYVPDTKSDNSDKQYCVYRNTTSDAAYTNIDVKDGVYKSLEFMANSERGANSIGSQKLAVKLNYSDGSEDVPGEYTLNLWPNNSGSEKQLISLANGLSGAGTIRYGAITHYTIPVDSEKTLVSFDILNDRYDFVTDDDGNYVLTNDGKYQTFDADGMALHKKTHKYKKDDEGNYAAYDAETDSDDYIKCDSRSTYIHTTAVYAMSFVQSVDEYAKLAAAEAISAIDDIEEPVTYENRDKVYSAKLYVDELISKGISTDYITNYSKYLAAIEVADSFVSTFIEPSAFVNSSGIYDSNAQSHANGTGFRVWSSQMAIHSGYFKSLPIWSLDWTEDGTENILTNNGFKYKLKIKDAAKGENVVLCARYETKQYKDIVVDAGYYSQLSVLAGAEQRYNDKETFKAVLIYEDGSEEIVEKIVTGMTSKGENAIMVYRCEDDGTYGTYSFYIKPYEVPVNPNKRLTCIRVLGNADSVLDEDTGKYDIVTPMADSTSQHRVHVFGLSLITTKQQLAEKYGTVIEEIEAMIDSVTPSAKDANVMKEIGEKIKEAENLGIEKNQISNIDKYYGYLPYFAEVATVSTSNDDTMAYITLTFDRTLPEGLKTSGDFSLMKDGKDVEGNVSYEYITNDDGITGVALSFQHGGCYDSLYAVKTTIGYGIKYNQRITLKVPFTFDDVTFEDEDNFSDLYNFYETESDNFTIRGIVNKNTDVDGSMVLAVYDDNGKLDACSIIPVNSEKTPIEEKITLTDIPNSAWTMKAMFWASLQSMKPVQMPVNMKKTYGYINVADNTKDLTITYFGDSQTAGGMYTNPLTDLFALSRSGNVSQYNLGVGGTSILLGMYRLDDVLKTNPDIVFVEFFPNDSSIGRNTPDLLVAYHESVIRRLLAAEKVPVIIYLNPMCKAEAQLEDGSSKPYNSFAVDALKSLLAEYDIPLIDFDVYAREQQAAGNTEYDWSNIVAADGTHFTSAGGRLCANMAFDLISNSFDDYVKMPNINAEKISETDYSNIAKIPSIYGMYSGDWENVVAVGYDEGYWTQTEANAFPEGFMATKTAGQTVTFKFSGTFLYLYTLVGNNCGRATWSIDGGKYTGTADLYSTYSPYKCMKSIITGIEDTDHTITFTVQEPNPSSTDATFGIGYFLTERD